MDLISMQVTNSPNTPIEDNTSVFILTREGKPYTDEGIKYIRESLKNMFNVTNDLSIYTGIGINEPKVLTELIHTTKNPYIVLSHKDGVGFFPVDANEEICETLIEDHESSPNMTSWQIIMKNCKLEVY